LVQIHNLTSLRSTFFFAKWRCKINFIFQQSFSNRKKNTTTEANAGAIVQYTDITSTSFISKMYIEDEDSIGELYLTLHLKKI